MIFGLGLDIVDVSRIEKILHKYGEKFAQKILSPKELELFNALTPGKTANQFIAGRFAAKEAAAKALGTGFSQGVILGDLEILPDSFGAPCLYFRGQAAEISRNHGVIHVHVSITHDRGVCAAVVVLENQER